MSGRPAIFGYVFEPLTLAVDLPPALGCAGSARLAEAAPRPEADPAVDPEVAAQWAREWADCSGAVLAKLIADALGSVPDLPDDLAGDQQIFDLIVANARLAAWATANQARLTALVHGRARAEHEAFGLVRSGPERPASAAGASHGYDDDRYTTSEIAATLSLELGQSMPVAEREVGFGLGLARDEGVRHALAVGRMDVAQARAVVAELDHIADPSVREPVVAGLVTDPQAAGAAELLVRELRPGRRRLWDLPPAQLRAIIRREATRLEPETAEIRLVAAAATRGVRFVPRRDAMADLVLSGPAHLLAAAYQHLDRAARSVNAESRRPGSGGRGDPTNGLSRLTLDELRHDIALAHLTAGEHGLAVGYADDLAPDAADRAFEAGRARSAGVVLRRRPRVRINVTVTAGTLLGLDDLPANLHSPAGAMPIPADLARRLAYDPGQVTWRRILCDPATGAATDVSPSYRPPPRIAEYVTVRDGYQSRFPGSTTTHLELDHVDPYRRDIRRRPDQPDQPDQPVQPGAGGLTTAANLAAAGQQDHHLKTDRAITVTGNANDALVYRARSGHPHVSWPHQYLDPVAGPDG